MLHLDFSAENVTILCGVICTLAMYSVLYGENRLFRLFEHLFIGIATGYVLATYWNNIIRPYWWDNVAVRGNWWWNIAIVMGSMYYFVYSKKYFWLSRLVIGFFFGIFAGLGIKRAIFIICPQLQGSFKDLWVTGAGGVIWYSTINNWIFLFALLTVMSYFFFSFEQKAKVLKSSATMGRWFIMIYLGAIFGTTVMGRMSLFIERLVFLLRAAHVPLG